MRKVVTLLVALTPFIATSAAFGAIIHVPADRPTIQAGINASSNGDTVLVQPDTYVENINFNGRNIVLGSLFLTTGDTSYISSTIIDGNSSGSVVRFVNGENSTAVITGFTIQNGLANPGGGLLCEGSEPTISHNIISGNSSGGDGGGIFCVNANPTISNNTIRGNSASDIGGAGGGGIACVYCVNPLINNNIISDNFANSGGGISSFDSNPAICDNTISGNVADGGGGIGLCCTSAGVISNNTISDNEAYSLGGGIYCNSEAHPTISDNIINGNRASGSFSYGGAICCNESDPPITNNIVSGNWADNGGGISCRAGSSGPIVNNTLSGNAANSGGGMHCDNNSGPSLENCIIAFSSGGGSVVCDPSCNPTFTCCDVYGNAGGDWVGCIASQAGINGNFSLDPLFCDTANNDYHISSASPCAPAHNSCGVLIGALGMGCATEPIAFIEPDTMYVFQAHTIDPLSATICFGDFTDGHTAGDVDTATIEVNGTIPPESWQVLPSHPDFSGEVMEITFPIRDFILGYMPLWDTTIQVYTVAGEFDGKCGFSIDGEVTMIGHISGDLNGDGVVSIMDLTCFIAFLFKGGAEPPVMEAADLDHNGVVNIADLAKLVRILFE